MTSGIDLFAEDRARERSAVQRAASRQRLLSADRIDWNAFVEQGGDIYEAYEDARLVGDDILADKAWRAANRRRLAGKPTGPRSAP